MTTPRDRERPETAPDQGTSPGEVDRGRRAFLGLVASSAALAACGDGGSGIGTPGPTRVQPPVVEVPPGPRVAGSPFGAGVASGDPTHDSVILWTRIAPAPARGGGAPPAEVPVGWEVAEDALFSRIVRTGVARARPASAHAVHVDVRGLRADRRHWYRFVADGRVSAIGRTRTLPAPGASPARLRIGIASCQNYRDGRYSAHAHLAKEDLDLLLFLGDYIYESGVKGKVRDHEGPEPTDLAGYRNRYGLYKSDPALQAAHAAFPWVATWDDHEVDNNYTGSQPAGGPRPSFAKRRAAAYQAYYEHLPLRRGPDARGGLPLHRQLAFGDLARFFVLDTRQHRSPPTCKVLAPCKGWPDPRASMLGAAQERWLLDGLAATRARWNVLAQGVVFSDLTLGKSVVNHDQWDGYPTSRQRILDQAAAKRVRGLMVLSGDIHAAALGRLSRRAFDRASPAIGSEIVCNSLTSGGTDGGATGLLVEGLGRAEPRIDYAYARRRGYVVCEITPDAWTVHFRVVDTVDAASATLSTHVSYRVQDAPVRHTRLKAGG